MSVTVVDRGPLAENTGPNGRGHWASRGTRELRALWFGLATAELGIWRERVPHFERVTLTVRGYYCRKRPPWDLRWRIGYRPTDADNLLASLKPAIDGLGDAGVFPNDTAKHVRHGAPELHVVDTFDEERTEITIEEWGTASAT